MTNYFIMEGEQEVGPLSISQLKLKSISNDTLVWFAGLNEWTKAGEVHELRILFGAKPSSSFFKNLLNKLSGNFVKSNSKNASYQLNYSRQRKNLY